MSEEQKLDDLFAEGDEAQTSAQPVASGSRSPSLPQSPVNGDVKEDDEDDDLFGDDDEDDRKRDASSSATPATVPSDDESEKAPVSRSKSRSRSRSRISRSRTGSGSPNPLEYEEEDEPEQKETTWANLILPPIPRMKPSDGKIWHMRLPAYVNIESQPYDPELYRATLDQEPIDGAADPVAAKARMIGVRNTIRWKWVTGPQGEPVRRSNSRMIRWSDGSMSLQVGSAMFDVAPSAGTTLARPQDIKPDTTKTEEPTTAGTSYVCTAIRSHGVLLTENHIAGQLSLVPASSTSKAHLELVKQVGQQHVKHSRMKVLEDVVAKDEIQTMIQKAAGRTFTKPKVKREGRRRRARSEESEDEIREPVGPGEYDEDDGFIVADDDEESEAEETEDSDDAAWGSSKKKKSKGKKGKKRKGSESLDEMEEAERKIEAKARAKKRAKRAAQKSREYVDTDEEDDADDIAGGAGEVEEDMEMESEGE